MKYLKIFEDYNFLFYLNEIEETYFSPYSKIVLDTNTEGYIITNKIAHVGARIAFIKNSTEALRDGLFHEMGHIVMFKNLERLKMSNFGFDYSTKDNLGYNVPISWNGIKNECKAIIWQSIICKKYDIHFNINDFVKALKYMEDFTNVPLKGCFKNEYRWYYNIEFTEEVNYRDSDKLRLETIKDYVHNESNNSEYTIINFDKRWSIRCQWLEDNL